MKLAIICGEKSESIKKRLLSINDNLQIDAYIDIDSMIKNSLQRQYFYDRILFASHLVRGDELDSFYKLKDYIDNDSMRSEVVYLCSARDTESARDFDEIFTTPNFSSYLSDKVTLETLKNASVMKIGDIFSKYSYLKERPAQSEVEYYDLEEDTSSKGTEEEEEEPETNTKKKKGLFGGLLKGKKKDLQEAVQSQNDLVNQEEYSDSTDWEDAYYDNASQGTEYEDDGYYEDESEYSNTNYDESSQIAESWNDGVYSEETGDYGDYSETGEEINPSPNAFTAVDYDGTYENYEDSENYEESEFSEQGGDDYYGAEDAPYDTDEEVYGEDAPYNEGTEEEPYNSGYDTEEQYGSEAPYDTGYDSEDSYHTGYGTDDSYGAEESYGEDAPYDVEEDGYESDNQSTYDDKGYNDEYDEADSYNGGEDYDTEDSYADEEGYEDEGYEDNYHNQGTYNEDPYASEEPYDESYNQGTCEDGTPDDGYETSSFITEEEVYVEGAHYDEEAEYDRGYEEEPQYDTEDVEEEEQLTVEDNTTTVVEDEDDDWSIPEERSHRGTLVSSPQRGFRNTPMHKKPMRQEYDNPDDDDFGSLSVDRDIIDDYKKDTTNVVVKEKIVVKHIPIDGAKGGLFAGLVNGTSKRTFVVTGDRGTGVTSLAWEMAKFLSQSIPVLYFDCDVRTHGLLSYVEYNEIVKFDHAQLHGTKFCRSTNQFYNCVIPYADNLDIITSNYGTHTTQDELAQTAQIIGEMSLSYGAVIIDAPFDTLPLIEDLLTSSTVLFCVTATKVGFMNAVCVLEDNKLKDRYLRQIFTKGKMVFTKKNKHLKVDTLKKYVNDIVELENINWLEMSAVVLGERVDSNFVAALLD